MKQLNNKWETQPDPKKQNSNQKTVDDAGEKIILNEQSQNQITNAAEELQQDVNTAAEEINDSRVDMSTEEDQDQLKNDERDAMNNDDL